MSRNQFKEDDQVNQWEGYEEVIHFFENNVIPSREIRLDNVTVIKSPVKFIQSYLPLIKATRNNNTFNLILTDFINCISYFQRTDRT